MTTAALPDRVLNVIYRSWRVLESIRIDFTFPILSPPAVTTGQPCKSSVALESLATMQENRLASALREPARGSPLLVVIRDIRDSSQN